MTGFRLLTLSILAVAALCCAGRPAVAAKQNGKPWLSIVTAKGKETAQVETQGQAGKATYWVVSPGNPVLAEVTGPGRLRILIRPEFPGAASAAAEVHLTISISGADSTDVAAFSVPASTARYAGKPRNAVPGEAVTAFLDVPEGKHSVRATARQRVGIKLYISH